MLSSIGRFLPMLWQWLVLLLIFNSGILIIGRPNKSKWVHNLRRKNKWRRKCMQYCLVLRFLIRHGKCTNWLDGSTFPSLIHKKRWSWRRRTAQYKIKVVYHEFIDRETSDQFDFKLDSGMVNEVLNKFCDSWIILCLLWTLYLPLRIIVWIMLILSRVCCQ